MNKKIIIEIIKIVCTAIISITSLLFAQSCTASFTLLKNNTNSSVEGSQSTKVDSASLTIPLFK